MSVKALISASQKDPSIGGVVYVQISLLKPAVDERQPHAILIPLPYRSRRKDELMTCLVCKDPSTQIANSIMQNPKTNKLFDEIIGVGKLRRRLVNGKRKHQQSEMMKTTKKTLEFAESFPLIFVQDNVSKALTELMGLGYLKHGKNLPIRVSIPQTLDEKAMQNLHFVVKAAFKCSQLILRPEAKVISVRVGHTLMDADKLEENVRAVVECARERIPKGLGKSAKYYVKTGNSLAIELARTSANEVSASEC